MNGFPGKKVSLLAYLVDLSFHSRLLLNSNYNEEQNNSLLVTILQHPCIGLL